MGDERVIGGPIPRGVEVLINKAAIDASFKTHLLTDRTGAAEAIGLILEPSEQLLLNAIPDSQLEMIIDKTVVPEEHKSAFLGKAAAAMILAITTMALSSCYIPATKGIAPERPPKVEETTEDPKTSGDGDPKTTRNDDISKMKVTGIRPDTPKPKPDANKPPEKDENKVSSPKGGSRPDRPPKSDAHKIRGLPSFGHWSDRPKPKQKREDEKKGTEK